MKLYLFFSSLSFLFCLPLLHQSALKKDPSPLAEFSSEWNNEKYLKCNTAANANYMNNDEKEVIYLLNLLHANPALFASTVVQKYPEHAGEGYLKNVAEYKSLLDTLQKIKPLPLIYPDSLCFVSAQCHAMSAGEAGYVGHERRTKECKKKYLNFGECCAYGYKKPLSILMLLLIDQNVSSLGHRDMCLSPYGKIGVSIQPHKGYGTNAVLDFYF